MPYPDRYEGALKLVSNKTGLQEELIKRWFARRREALGAKKMKPYDEEEIQILDREQVEPDSVQEDFSDLDEDVELDDDDYILLDEAHAEEEEDLEQFFIEKEDNLVSVTSTSGPEKSNEEKAAGYDIMSLQFEKLKAEMMEMSKSLNIVTEAFNFNTHILL